ncbi:type III secretion system inner rod subunit SctI [Chromobacterium violaceum]|uniref:type III secretion system inner rod subunit SctI n=1 Tax=Chromobacterium violaceum TaxID=536 RepID=UPI0009D9C48F|nr:type III secretion system inner rod subunit SctI [Chromobacterium violaceum]MBP4049592.1 type III secretion system inner rod subunit SctI [Chromobacterium violaceum]MBX9267146.1 type III secretion system inner rod subunit SctI [Chromobacterium violaceum]OQS28729.1 type III secretion system protein PrgJ [Chromobacterium violaceum]OQS46902.1 type III secretion system protein PrgJ [Chromobacterium violaceum]OQS51745.1 type III secretion system protein PrgJ [Chromobacterium violaceum]
MKVIGPAASQALAQASDLGQTDAEMVSLEDRLIQAFSHAAVATEAERNDIMQRLERPELISNPAELASLQLRISNYNLRISMISTEARKATGAIEGVLRS